MARLRLDLGLKFETESSDVARQHVASTKSFSSIAVDFDLALSLKSREAQSKKLAL